MNNYQPIPDSSYPHLNTQNYSPLTVTPLALENLDVTVYTKPDCTIEQMHTVISTLTQSGLEVLSSSDDIGQICLQGLASVVEKTFNIKISQALCHETKEAVFYIEGAISAASNIAHLIDAVVGIDQRPIGKPHYRTNADTTAPHSVTPVEVADAYRIPAADGKGQTIAVIELGGGYFASDFEEYFSALGLPQPTITSVSVDGANNSPYNQQGLDPANGEVALDVEVIGAVVPRSSIKVYFAPNTDASFINAVFQAQNAQPQPAAISISWGGPETNWTGQSRRVMDRAIARADAAGIPVCCSAGDRGSSDGKSIPTTDYPGSSPRALSCGGTRLTLDGTTIVSETVWNDDPQRSATGGGLSTLYPAPSYQKSIVLEDGTPLEQRGVPDIAGNADPVTGYRIRVNGKETAIGGTSAVSPLWSAFIARFNQITGGRIIKIHDRLYSGFNPSSRVSQFTRDIVEGNNGSYQASPGWDPCTGLGVANESTIGAFTDQDIY